MSLVAIAKKNVAKARVNETGFMNELMKKLKTDLKTDLKEEMAKKITKGTIEFLLDCSGSMEGKKLAQAKRGILSFATKAKKSYLFELISFSHEASLICSWESQISQIKDRMEEITASDNTRMAKAIQFAANRLGEKNSKKQRIIVVATDGEPTDPGPTETLRVARKIKSGGIDIIAIGTDGADENFLKQFASRKDLGQKVEQRDFGKAIAISVKKIKALPTPE